MKNENFAHLHVHDEYSLLDGVGKNIDFVKRAKELEFKYLAITNHGNIDCAITFQKNCEKIGSIAPIFGCELYIVPNANITDKNEKRGHLLVLIKNKTGWQNLLKILTFANVTGFYKRPRTDYRNVLEHSEGLIFSTACILSFLNNEGGIDFFEKLLDKNKDDVYLEIMPHIDPDGLQINFNKKILNLHEKYGTKLISTTDAHYINNEDKTTQEILLAIQTKAKWKDKNRFKFTYDKLYLQTANEIIIGLKKQGIFSNNQIISSMENTIEIAEKCKDFRIEKIPVYLPPIKQCIDINEEEFFKQKCIDGFNSKIINTIDKNNLQKYYDRFDEEYKLIKDLGFIRYFLIVWELINWCKENDIMTGPGRGSSGGSLIAYLLGITWVDPIKYGLLFSRFINPARIDLPDIDIDFEDIKRGEVRKHLENIYGISNVAGASTFSKMKGRSAIRDVARVFDIPLNEVDIAAKSISTRVDGDERAYNTIEDSFKTFEDGKNFYKKYPAISDQAIKLEGQIRNCGVHAAAVIISNDSLCDGLRVNLKRSKNEDEYVVNWDKNDVEHVGLMKLDVLGLNALTVMHEAQKLIKENHNVDIDFMKITLDDSKIFSEFTKGNNIGIFQFGSLGLRKVCKEIIIDNFNTLTDTNALFRPGTLRTGMVQEYINRKNYNKQWQSKHPILDEITKDTYGIILYQEQVMLLANKLAGFDWKTSDSVRKVIGKSKGEEQFKKFKQQFIDGCKKNQTLDEQIAGETWDELASFGFYSFNKSHAVEYSYISYLQMWLKMNYPAEFLACSLTYGSNEKKEELIEEAKRLGLQINLPKYELSDIKTWKVKDNNLYIPFLEVKGIGEKNAEILNKRNNGFCGNKKVNKRIQSILDNMKADDKNYIFSENEIELLRPYFNFEISNDPLCKYRKLCNFLNNRINFSDIKDVDHKKQDKSLKYYFGKITELKCKYDGGAYGNIKDDTDFNMIGFGTNLYQCKKDIIEHCEGKFILSESVISEKSNVINCLNLWSIEDLYEGKINGLEKVLNLVNKNRYRNNELLNCRDCNLRNNCKNPVMPSFGLYNIVIIGEAPGYDENEQGMGFVGKTGNFLWEKLEEFSLYRKMFHVTNINKCWPGRGNPTPTQENIQICSKWLNDELLNLKPCLILCFGNNSLKFFKDIDGGITNYNGTTEWIDKYNCWICWSVHPSSVLYGGNNAMENFHIGIKNFADKVKLFSNGEL